MASDDVLAKLSIHGEFLQNLNVANFFIGLKNGFEGDKLRKVTFERKRIVVSVESEDERVREASISLPGRVSLVPRSLSGVRPSSPGGCAFRLAFESRSEPLPTDPLFIPRCHTCHSELLNRKEFAGGLLLSVAAYFCHAHRNSAPEVGVPRAVSSFGEYFQFHACALDAGRLLVGPEEHVRCARCHQHLGFADRKLLLLLKHRLSGWAGSGLSAVLQQLTSANRFHLTPKEVESGSCVEVCVLDRRLLLFQAGVGEGEEVCKVLFRVTKTPEVGPEVKVDAGLALGVLQALERSRKGLPVSWQPRVNGFSVGFLN